MRRTTAIILAVLMIVSLGLFLAGCGDSSKKQEAIQVFNSTSEEFNELSGLINANAHLMDSETISVFQQMSALLNQYRDILMNGDDISDEKYEEMTEWFETAKAWIEESKAELEQALDSMQ